MSTIRNKLWVEKYRPSSIDQYVFYDQHLKHAVTSMLDTSVIPQLLLSGSPGCGKTTLAQILINHIIVHDSDALLINASEENNVDVMREKIKNFISTCPMGDYKIVLLDECDMITPAGQGILRRMMEEYADVARFIMTCNNENKVLPAIRSRCQHFHFKKPSHDDIAECMVTILASEKVKFDLDLVDKFVAISYPDIRKTINTVQQHVVQGHLVAPQTSDTTIDYKYALLEALSAGDWTEARQVVCANATSDEWDHIYRFMYENIKTVPAFKQKDKWEEAITIIAEHLYKHTLCADSEINFAAMMIRLGMV